MNDDARAWADLCLTPTNTLTKQAEQNLGAAKTGLEKNRTELRKLQAVSATFTDEQAEKAGRISHELSHYQQEFDDLISHPSVNGVCIIDNGICVTTTPISSFKGIHSFEIDLVISQSKPTFRVVGQSYGFQLRCLNGASHDSEMTKLLKEARLAEAAILAIDLIGFGDEGGPHNDDNGNDY